jgi:hypothetical protein
MKEAEILANAEEEGFDMAFEMFQPVIQGTADTETKDAKVQKTAADGVDFALSSFEMTPEKQQAVINKVELAQTAPEVLEKLTPEEIHILGNIVVRTFQHVQDEKNLLENFTGETIDGLTASIVRGDLGLFKE